MRYKLYCVNPLSKRLNVSLTLKKYASDPILLNLSKWRPGRYEFGNFAARLYSLTAIGQDGSNIVITKNSTHQWVVDDPYTGELTIQYQVYANQLDAGGTFITEDFWLVNPVNCLLGVDGREGESTEIELDLPQHFQVSTSLRETNGHWIAASQDELMDSPLLASAQLEKIEFTVDNKAFVLAIHGKHELDRNRLVNDFTQYTLAQHEVLEWNDLDPYEYQLLFFPFKIYHGVEHMNGTTIVLGPADDPQFYEHLMGVSSHELFHYWNIKRIRPQQLSPYRFNEENYFDTGYVAEGFTTYYGDLFLVRGGVFDEVWYLSELNRLLKRHFENYGRNTASLKESSMDLWVDGYRNEAPHRKVSIYVKGALVALMLDLAIRRATRSMKSLDNVVQVLWQEFGKNSEGYINEDIKRIAEETSGLDLTEFFDQYIHGKLPIGKYLSELLDWVGLKLNYSYPEDRLMTYLGIRTQRTPDGHKVVSTVPESLGEDYFTAGDEILMINEQAAQALFSELVEGENRFELIRLGAKRAFSVELVAMAYYESPIVSVNEDASREVQQRRSLWLKTQKNG